MNPRIIQVKPLDNYELELRFTNNEVRFFDVKPYLNIGIFSELRDNELFKTVRPFNGTVVWANQLDFCPDTLYIESIKNS